MFTVFTSIHSRPGWPVLYQVKCSQSLQVFIVGQVACIISGEVFTVTTSVHSWSGWPVLYHVKCSQSLQVFIVGQVDLYCIR